MSTIQKYLSGEKGMTTSLASITAIIVTLILSFTAIRFANKDHTISVTGSTERIVTSDTVKISINLSNRELTKEKATEEGARALNTLTGKLIAAGVDKSSITEGQQFTEENCQLDRNQYPNCSLGVTAYSSKNSVVVQGKNIDELLKAVKETASSDYYVEYYYNELSNVRGDLLKEATKNANERATAIAEAAGGSVGGVVSAQSGVFQVTQKNSTDFSDYGTYDVTTREKKVSATIKVQFQVK